MARGAHERGRLTLWEALEGAVLRWIHVLVGIMWVGLLYYFNFVNVDAAKQANAAGEGAGHQ